MLVRAGESTDMLEVFGRKSGENREGNEDKKWTAENKRTNEEL
jgi:hypothetical protein